MIRCDKVDLDFGAGVSILGNRIDAPVNGNGEPETLWLNATATFSRERSLSLDRENVAIQVSIEFGLRSPKPRSAFVLFEAGESVVEKMCITATLSPMNW